MTSVFFSDTEVGKYTQILLDNGVDCFAWNFYWINRNRKFGSVYNIQDELPYGRFILSPGTGSFLYKNEGQPESEKLRLWDSYLKSYLQYINETWFRWSVIGEPDLDELVPLPVIDGWRNEMIAQWPHAKIAPIWRESRGWAVWEGYLKDPRIKALSVDSSVTDIGVQQKLVHSAHSVGKSVHGFRQSKADRLINNVHWDSVCTPSWLDGKRYGTLYIFQGSRFIRLSKSGREGKSERSLYRKHFKAIGVDWRAIERGDMEEIVKANILAWRRLSDRLQEIRKRQERTADTFNLIRTDTSGE
jgi:hypothetical protein